jgi:hypothetical protein
MFSDQQISWMRVAVYESGVVSRGLDYKDKEATHPQEKVMADIEEMARSIASLGLMPISAILSLSFSL